MTISPADVLRAALVAALIAWPLRAGAQEQPPDNATGAPRTLPGVAVQTLPDASQPNASEPQQANSVTVAPLGAPEGAPAGLLDSSNGGLGEDIWSGTPRSDIDLLLAALPIASPVYSERELARRLLLTVADAPVGAAPHAFLTLRLEGLMSAGFVLEASILAANSQVPGDAEYARTAADAILFSGHANEACGKATELRLQSGDRFWMELRAYCYAVAGDGAALDLTRSVMTAQNQDDKAFDILLDDVMTHKTVDPGPIAYPTSLHLFLLREAGLPVNVGLAKQLGMPALVLALDEPRNSPEDRASAAEDVLRAGAVPMAHLIAVADVQKFSEEQLGRTSTEQSALPFFMGQAYMRAVAAHASSESEKAQDVADALAMGLHAHLLEVAAGMQSDVALSLSPGVAFPSNEELLARALMLSGNPDAAAHWRNQLGPGKNQLTPAALDIELNLVSPSPARAADAQAALTWLSAAAATKETEGDQHVQAFAALALGIYDALGEPMPADATPVAATQWPGRRPPLVVMSQLETAAKAPGRKGEALLLILNAVGANGPGDLAPDVTVDFVRALKDIGVADAAREFAIDALLLYELAPLPPQPAAP